MAGLDNEALQTPEWLARSYFRTITPERRQKYLHEYNEIIDRPLRTVKLPGGKVKHYQQPEMLWMVSAWEEGRKILIEVINELDK